MKRFKPLFYNIWYREPEKNRFHIIEMIDWEDACGETEAKEIGAKYNVALSEVDLNTIPLKELSSAILSGSGDVVDLLDRFRTEDAAAALFIAAEAHQYGLKAPLFDQNGNNFAKLKSLAIKESLDLDDEDYYEKAMDRPVNKIGSTAREYMMGDIFCFGSWGNKRGCFVE